MYTSVNLTLFLLHGINCSLHIVNNIYTGIKISVGKEEIDILKMLLLKVINVKYNLHGKG